jgi:YidC/Oxa1 family membrane protein insertase
MDKNTITGFLLIFLLFLGFSFYNSKKVTQRQEEQRQEAENRRLKAESDMAQEQTLQLQSDLTADTVMNVTKETGEKPFSTLIPQDESDYRFETNLAIYTIAKKGGYISQVELKNIYRHSDDSVKLPLHLFEGNHSIMNMDLMLKDQTVIQLKDYYFLTESETAFKMNEQDKQTCFSLKLYPTEKNGDTVSLNKESYVEYLYTFANNDYLFDFDIRFVNMEKYLYTGKHAFTLNWNAELINVEKSYQNEKRVTTLYYMDNVDKVENLSEQNSERKEYPTPLKWIAYRQQFFTSVIIADSTHFSSGELSVADYDKTELLKLRQMNANLDFELQDLNNGQFNFSLYFGPNQYKLLKEYNLNLERLVPLGWGFFLLHWINRFAVIPVFNWLESYGLNYGIIILILTIFLKTILLPIAYKTYLSSARMRILKPELEEIAARYPKPDEMAKKQQATMALYKSAGVSPAAGCLPMLLQMPILIAMFRFFPSAYELRQQSFLWATDLSSYDSVYNFSFNIPFYGNHVSLFTLLMTISTLIYTWLNNKMMSPVGNDPSQKMMKNMMYIMPILFLGLFNSFSAALTYYYLLVNLITFFQMWVFRMMVNEEKLKVKIKANMQKPVKKSKWQQRMEELTKQQAQMQKKGSSHKK